MSTIQSPIHPQPFGGGAGFDDGAGLGRSLFLTLRWIVAVTALMALGVFAVQGLTSVEQPSAGAVDQIVTEQVPAGQTTFDGRGKWSGYAR
ncbi:hypothetical protein HBA54_00725 [Pelagibius litoralis]|uniref:Uncharacterized protein n=1 Tax=Pelagibius litoralis TaxID=374515 RepID=A0A967C2U3_9PROT|nr:hypothetical protein [Pelagibius litoralis]NIA67110.1 hypothetical protein [Pelagibius litoralis]